ncbi:MAG: acyl-CoA thioesterase [Treponema sp.]|nr:acyl-CoA thioesterase [Treponema sp.]
MKNYVHTVHYYETDKMAITHHSNYIRWMEEARVDFLDQLGWGFDKLEAAGISSPVLSVTCNYKQTTTFADKVEIHVFVKEFTGVRLTIGYEMKKAGTDITACTGTSEHCFLNAQTGRPVRLQKDFPGFYEAIIGCTRP